MKIVVPTNVLLDAVGHAASVAATKSPKPVLECVALRADATTGLALEATDLDVGIRLHVDDARVEEPGVLLVPGSRLLSILREVEADEVSLVGDDRGLSLETAGSHFRIRGEDPETFVELPFFPKQEALSLDGDVLRSMIRRTVFATAKEAGRYALHGVLFKVAGTGLELVATDGRRLARATHTLAKAAARDLKVIIGPKALGLLDRILANRDTEVALALQERQVLFRVGGALVISRLIDGTFPAYEDVIPQPTGKGFEIAASDFAAALRRAALLTTRDSMSVQFDVEPSNLTIRSRAPEVGEARVELPVDYDGSKERIGFNPMFLVDALKVMDPEENVRFEFSDGKAPGRLSDSDHYVYVVMPIALE